MKKGTREAWATGLAFMILGPAHGFGQESTRPERLSFAVKQTGGVPASCAVKIITHLAVQEITLQSGGVGMRSKETAPCRSDKGARAIRGWVAVGVTLGLGSMPWMVAGQTGSVHPPITPGQTARPDWTDISALHTPAPIRIDGRLDEAVWDQADPIALAWETQPELNAAAAFQTDCRILFGPDHLYFGCRAYDPDPGSIRAFMTDRDAAGGQDQIGLWIDPFNDSRRAYGLNVNPLGVQGDWVIAGGEGNDSWDIIWTAQGRITEDGWVAEAAVPLKSLRFPASAQPLDWRFYMWRSRPRSVEAESRSVPRNPSSQCFLCQMAHLRNVVVQSSGSNLSIAPYSTVQRVDEVGSSAGALAAGPTVGRYGADFRWNPTSDLTVNLTANPDFSQIEADELQIQSNQQFALFFPEKRPFFLEAAELFQTPQRAAITRSIADPDGGAKLSGKRGPWGFGVLGATDRITNLIFPGALGSRSTSLDQGNRAFIGRLQRDIGSSSTVGGMVTRRSGTDYQNLLASADLNWRVHPSTTVTAQAMHSTTDYPDEVVDRFDQPSGSFTGWNLYAKARFDVRKGNLQSEFMRVGSGFRADAGFITGSGFRRLDLRGQRIFWPERHPFFTRLFAGGGAGYSEQIDGTPLYNFVFISTGFDGPAQSHLSVNPDRFRRWFEGERFTIDRLNFFAEISPSGRISAELFWQFGEDLDYANAREAGLFRMQQSVDARIGRAVHLQLNFDVTRLSTGGQPIFREQAAEAVARYYFSNRLFLRGTLQFRDVKRDPSLYRSVVTPRSRGLDSQLLLSYKLNPQSALAIGYSDSSMGLRENADPSAPLDLTRISRSFFMKMSYEWRP